MITLISLVPTSVRMGAELGLLFGLGAAPPPAPAPPPAGIAIGIAAAADTPSSGLERLDELRELEDRDSLDVIDNLLLIQFGHCSLCS